MRQYVTCAPDNDNAKFQVMFGSNHRCGFEQWEGVYMYVCVTNYYQIYTHPHEWMNEVNEWAMYYVCSSSK